MRRICVFKSQQYTAHLSSGFQFWLHMSAKQLPSAKNTPSILDAPRVTELLRLTMASALQNEKLTQNTWDNMMIERYGYTSKVHIKKDYPALMVVIN